MEPAIPKRRGRRKKHPVDNLAAGAILAPNTLQMADNRQVADGKADNKQMADSKVDISEKTLAELKIKQERRRTLKNQQILERAVIFDKKVESDEFISRIHDSFMNILYPNYKQKELEDDLKYTQIYHKIISNKKLQYHKIFWEEIITKNSVNKICELINHILLSGPLTESEIDILDRCVSLLKEYYAERADLMNTDQKNKELHHSNTYFPPRGSYAYKIFVTRDDAPSNVNPDN